MNDVREITSLLSNPTAKDTALIQKAYDFTSKAHEGQLRKNGDKFVSHLYATAKNIAELGMGSITISAGLLHDTLEDTKVTREELRKEFGDEILFLVEGVTNLGALRYHGRERYTESLRKLFMAMSQDIRVLIIKLCDRLHNMQTLSHLPREKRLRIAKETLEIYAPLANRLGIKKLQRDLEDSAFQYVYPEEFEKIKKVIKLKGSSIDKRLDDFEKVLKKELARNGITKFRMDHRVKGLYSLYKKMQKFSVDAEHIYDILALRIIVSDIPECYKILGAIHAVWKPLPGRIIDYIASPKLNGYRSLHTTIFTGDGGIVEIQIRTEEMHKEAEYGIASHLSYKEEGMKSKSANTQLIWANKIVQNKIGKKTDENDVPNWIRELVEHQRETGSQLESNIKTNFFDDRIFVFTPVGDVIDLPKGSSVIDFAYAIHTDIGNKMYGAKVNGKFVTIDTVLQNGDRVIIETKKNAKPSIKWLDHCKTGMARRHIQNAIDKSKTR